MKRLGLAALACALCVFAAPVRPQSTTRYCVWTRQAIPGTPISLVVSGRTYYVCCAPHKTRIEGWDTARRTRFLTLWRTREELLARKLDTERAMDRLKIDEE